MACFLSKKAKNCRKPQKSNSCGFSYVSPQSTINTSIDAANIVSAPTSADSHPHNREFTESVTICVFSPKNSCRMTLNIAQNEEFVTLIIAKLVFFALFASDFDTNHCSNPQN